MPLNLSASGPALAAAEAAERQRDGRGAAQRDRAQAAARATAVATRYVRTHARALICLIVIFGRMCASGLHSNVHQQSDERHEFSGSMLIRVKHMFDPSSFSSPNMYPSINAQLSSRSGGRVPGAAHVGDGQLVAAKRDYEAAVAADPHDLALIQDLQRINQSLRDASKQQPPPPPAPPAAAAANAEPVPAHTEQPPLHPIETQPPVSASTVAEASAAAPASEASISASSSASSASPAPSPIAPLPASSASSSVSAPASGAGLNFASASGSDHFAAGRFADALAAFGRLVAAAPSDPAPWLNRAAAHLALGDCGACVADCNRALELIAAASSVSISTSVSSSAPDMGGAAKTDALALSASASSSSASAGAKTLTLAQMECVALVRRAAATCWLGRPALGAEDLRAALQLCDASGSGSRSDSGGSASSSVRSGPAMTAAEIECVRADLQRMETAALLTA